MVQEEGMQAIRSPADLAALRKAVNDRRDPSKPCLAICAGTGCQAYGVNRVIEAFVEELENRGLAEEVDVLATGCPGFCERGPLVVVKPEGIFYQRVQINDVSEIVEKTLVSGQVVERLLYEDPSTGRKSVHEADVPFQIGVSHMSAQISRERLRRVVHLRPGAVQLILPDWFPTTEEENIRFLITMAETADGIGLVLYNPPHAKRVLSPREIGQLSRQVPALIGLKTAGGDEAWYFQMREHLAGISVFVPGHLLASGQLGRCTRRPGQADDHEKG